MNNRTVLLICQCTLLILAFMLTVSCGGKGGGPSISSAATTVSSAPPFVPKLVGLAFGPYVDGGDPDRGALASASTINSLLATLQGSGTGLQWIRTYGSTNGLEAVADLAHASGFKLAHGIWVNENLAATHAQIDAGIAAANAGLVDALIVGSEVLLFDRTSQTQLLDYINQVKAAVPASVLVTYADVFHELAASPDILDAVDVVCAHMHPYWSGIALDNALAAVDAWYQALVDLARGKPVWVCESGWPSDGASFGDAAPGPQAAVDYLTNFLSWAESKDVHYFFFQSHDEPWKSRLEGDVGDHWGLWDQFSTLKSGMEAPLIQGRRVGDNWSGSRVTVDDGIPAVEFVQLPPRGSTQNLTGRVLNVNPLAHNLAVYIRVSGRWWTKPTFAQPLTPVNPDGSFRTDITTGGQDTQATDVAAYLLPIGVKAPRAAGAAALPRDLERLAVASLSVTRD